MKRYQDHVVLVTGTNRNTGLAIAEAFAKEGAIVAMNGRKAPELHQVAERLRQDHPGRIIECVADIAQPDAVAAMFAQLQQETGRLDVLVNNAVVQAVGHSLVDTPPDFLEETFRVNVFGSYYCAQHAARMMLAGSRGGSIINIGSNTAERAINNRTAYVASKAAMDGLTRAMAVELGPVGIRVNCVVAGYIHTPRWDSLSDDETVRRRANIPLGQEAEGHDIAESVLFLASPAARRIHGARLVVDGGALAQLVPMDCDF